MKLEEWRNGGYEVIPDDGEPVVPPEYEDERDWWPFSDNIPDEAISTYMKMAVAQAYGAGYVQCLADVSIHVENGEFVLTADDSFKCSLVRRITPTTLFFHNAADDDLEDNDAIEVTLTAKLKNGEVATLTLKTGGSD